MISLQDQRIFISGAAAGMGYSVARLAAAAGAQVHATDLISDGLENLAQDGVHTALLDVTIQNQILSLLNNLQKELDLSYIFISHDMRVIRAIANKIIVLKDGLIVEENYSKNIFISPKSEYTKKLISSVI